MFIFVLSQLKMKRFFTFFLILFSIHFEGYSSGCGIGNQALNADGTFESLAGVASDFSLNGGACYQVYLLMRHK